MSHNYITDEVRAIIGARSEWVDACHPVQESEIRRFFQATMDPNPRYWDVQWAAASRYGKPVAPPAFPVHAFRRSPDEIRDPLDSMGDPDFDGVSRALRPGLPKVPVPLSGILNGGYEYEFYSYAGVGREDPLPQQLSRHLSARRQVRASGLRPGRGRIRDRRRPAAPQVDQHQHHAMTRGEDRVFRRRRRGTGAADDAQGTDEHRAHRALVGVDGELAPHPLRLALRDRPRRLPNVLVNGSWKQHVLVQLLTDWVGETGWLWRMNFQYRGMNVPGDTLTAWGRVTGKELRGDLGIVNVEIGLKDQNAVETSPGTAVVVLPRRGGRSVPYPFDPAILG